MAVTFTDRDGTFIVAIHCEEDLKLSPKLKQIAPPPADGRCECCGKHITELEPFSVVGHPWGVDVENVLLVKNSRPSVLRDERVDGILKEFLGGNLSNEDYEKAMEKLHEVYGHEMAEHLLRYNFVEGQVSASWDCCDCMQLDTEAYLEMPPLRYSQGLWGYITIKHEKMMQRIAAVARRNCRYIPGNPVFHLH